MGGGKRKTKAARIAALQISPRPRSGDKGPIPSRLAYNNPMPNHADVLIIGGGVIGLTTAYFLAGEGVAVTLLDQGDFGQQASWAGAGIIPPGNPDRARTAYDRLRALSSRLYPDLSLQLREATGIDNGYLVCGGIELSEPGGDSSDEWRAEGIAFQPV